MANTIASQPKTAILRCRVLHPAIRSTMGGRIRGRLWSGRPPAVLSLSGNTELNDWRIMDPLQAAGHAGHDWRARTIDTAASCDNAGDLASVNGRNGNGGVKFDDPLTAAGRVVKDVAVTVQRRGPLLRGSFPPIARGNFSGVSPRAVMPRT